MKTFIFLAALFLGSLSPAFARPGTDEIRHLKVQNSEVRKALESAFDSVGPVWKR